MYPAPFTKQGQLPVASLSSHFIGRDGPFLFARSTAFTQYVGLEIHHTIPRICENAGICWDCMEQGEEMYCIVHFTLLSIGAFVLCKMLISAVDCAKQGQLLLWTLSHHFVSCFEVVTNLLHLRHTIMPTFKRISSSLSSSSSSQSAPS